MSNPANQPILRVGDTGPAVERLSSILHSQGFWDHGQVKLYSEALEDAVEYFQSTHIDKFGRPLGSDGVVGELTWWALYNPSDDEQRNFFDVGRIPTGLTPERVKLLELVVKDRGIREQPNGSNRGPEIDTFLPSWWINRHAPRDRGPAWCCFYALKRSHDILGKHVLGGHFGSTHKAWRRAQELGMTTQTPTAGDLFVLLNPGGTGHIGFTYWVSAKPNIFYTVEGNCGNRVKVGKRATTASNHAGFINLFGDDLASRQEHGDLGVEGTGRLGTR